MLVFPSSPNEGDVFAPGPGFPSWLWDGDKWTKTTGGLTFSLDALTDVAVSDLAQGETLTWNAAAEKWTNVAPPEAIMDLAGLTDVAVANPAQGQMLAWDATAEKWMNTTPTPPPPTPSLSGLADTNFANLGAGQALTWSGSEWVNANIFSGPVIMNAGAAETNTLYVHGAVGEQAGYFSGSNEVGNSYGLVVVAGTNATDNAFSVYLKDWSLPFAISGDGSGRLGLNAPMTWNTTGSFYVGPPTANGPAFQCTGMPSNWTQQIYGASSGTSYGLFINAGTYGTSAIDSPFQIVTTNNTPIFRIWGDGSGYWGPTYDTSTGWIRAPMTLDWMGNMTLGLSGMQPTNPHRCVIAARDSQTALYAQSSGNAWIAQIINTNTTGTSYGLLVNAGLSSNDWALQISRRTGGALLACRGDGYVQMASTGTTATTGGYIDPSGWCYRSSSVRAMKTNIRDVTRERAREILLALRAIQFNSLSKADDPTQDHYGLIAEDVAEVDPTLVQYDAEGKPFGVCYDRVAMLMLPLMQELLEKELC